MIIPAAMFIESAEDALRTVDAKYLADQQRELYEATGENAPQFVDGYNLGLQTARTMIALNPDLAVKGIDPNNIL